MFDKIKEKMSIILVILHITHTHTLTHLTLTVFLIEIFFFYSFSKMFFLYLIFRFQGLLPEARTQFISKLKKQSTIENYNCCILRRNTTH